ncbi:hypothetical protein A0H81_07133 [Grifola frondosa]|uniref:Uncharacterized protein n=1 Tax=Grifola frondosa TaxID=5627 RepID=A0A1C7M8Y5_GRIFR|nr:hypothetical protein A0H81_07133 [Grifola frondosa]
MSLCSRNCETNNPVYTSSYRPLLPSNPAPAYLLGTISTRTILVSLLPISDRQARLPAKPLLGRLASGRAPQSAALRFSDMQLVHSLASLQLCVSEHMGSGVALVPPCTATSATPAHHQCTT